MASDQFGTGGGFSALLRREPAASWQSEAVAAYLRQPETKKPPFPPAGAFAVSGRATPDVSALGEGFQVETIPFQDDPISCPISCLLQSQWARSDSSHPPDPSHAPLPLLTLPTHPPACLPAHKERALWRVAGAWCAGIVCHAGASAAPMRLEPFTPAGVYQRPRGEHRRHLRLCATFRRLALAPQ